MVTNFLFPPKIVSGVFTFLWLTTLHTDLISFQHLPVYVQVCTLDSLPGGQALLCNTPELDEWSQRHRYGIPYRTISTHFCMYEFFVCSWVNSSKVKAITFILVVPPTWMRQPRLFGPIWFCNCSSTFYNFWLLILDYGLCVNTK